jgi:DNA-directed RNA polymerase specialized sigma24 family protein
VKSNPLPPVERSGRGTPVRKDGLVRFLYLQFQNRIAAAINDLPEQERLVMTLYYYEELSLVQIGIAIGESYDRASQIYACALLNLRSRLRDSIDNWQRATQTCARPPTNGTGSVMISFPPPEKGDRKVH